MDDSLFRRIVLPALLASSTGFAALTWPVASDYSTEMSQRLPQPLSDWATSTLITSQRKEFSSRYIGFAILSSVAIGAGTAGVMRKRQSRVQHHQKLLEEVLTTASDGTEPALGGDRSQAEAVHSVEEPLPTGVHTVADTTDAAAVAPERPSLDWAGLLHSATPEEPALSTAVLSTPMGAHQIYQIREVNQHHCLALKLGDEYYRYYRRRPSLERTQALVQQLQRRGQRAIATGEGSGYVVWIYQPAPITPIAPWPAGMAAYQG